MKNKLGLLIVLMLIITFGISAIAQSTDDDFYKVGYKLNVGSDLIHMNKNIYVKDNHLYVPCRDLCNALNIPILWDKEKKEVTIDTYNKPVPNSKYLNPSFKSTSDNKPVIPDKETAYKIGKVLLEKYMGKSLEYETKNTIFYLDTSYIEEYNCWEVSQNFKFKENNRGVSDIIHTPTIGINKNTGEVMYMDTESDLDDVE